MIILFKFWLYIQGTTFPAINALLAQWVPPLERGKIGSLVFAGQYNNLILQLVSFSL